jgi:hypothetical protein
LRAIHRLDSANCVVACAVFLVSPLNLTFTSLN